MVNDVLFTEVPCLVKSQITARSTDVNKFISSANLSAGCENGLVGRGKHKAVKCTNPKCPLIHQIERLAKA